MNPEDDAFGLRFRNEVMAAYRRGLEDGRAAALAEIARMLHDVVA